MYIYLFLIFFKMSVTTCALSGHPLKTPVVSIKSGHIFEKEIILKHLLNTG